MWSLLHLCSPRNKVRIISTDVGPARLNDQYYVPWSGMGIYTFTVDFLPHEAMHHPIFTHVACQAYDVRGKEVGSRNLAGMM